LHLRGVILSLTDITTTGNDSGWVGWLESKSFPFLFLRLTATDGIMTIITALNFRAVIIPEGAGESKL